MTTARSPREEREPPIERSAAGGHNHGCFSRTCYRPFRSLATAPGAADQSAQTALQCRGLHRGAVALGGCGRRSEVVRQLVLIKREIVVLALRQSIRGLPGDVDKR